MIGRLVVSLILLVANAFFVAVEFALVASRRSRLEQLAEGGDARARAAVASVRDLPFMLSASQLGVTLASLGLGYVAEPLVAPVIETPLGWLRAPEGAAHPIAIVLGLMVVAFVHTVLGEMVPKNVAIAEPDRAALWLALPMRGFTVLFRPAIHALNLLSSVGLALLRVESSRELEPNPTGAELAGMLTASRDEGLLDEVEHRLMTGALGFPARTVRSVVVPREQVVAVRAGTVVDAVEQVAGRNGHSRLPVYGRDLDEIVGYVHAKDLLALPLDARHRPLPRSIIRHMLTVRAEGTLMELLLTMKRTRLHFAVVLDDGGLVGIATLEDVLESLVGDIRDEHDRS